MTISFARPAKYLYCVPVFFRYRLSRRFGLTPPLPVSLTLCISYKCNSRCKTCFMWEHPPAQELSISEWEKILRSLGRSPLWVTIGGGEPFLSESLVAIVRFIAAHNRPIAINIPTNCLLPEAVEHKMREILASCRHTGIIVNMSLDNTGDKHDRIRGVEGNFEKFQDCYRRLRALQEKHGNLFIGFNTTISKFNVADCPEIFAFVKAAAPDSYITEIADERQELHNFGSGLQPAREDYYKAIALFRKQFARKQARFIPRLIQGMRYRYYKYVEDVLAAQEELLPCYAGIASAYIDSSGGVWPCCRMKPASLGNLKDFGCDFPRAWKSKAAADTRREIKGSRCRCFTANNFYTNCILSPFKAFARWR